MDPTKPSSAPHLTIPVPPWLGPCIAAAGARFATDEARMALAIRLAEENVQRGGSPFGAVVFAGDRVLAGGVNQVLETGYSIAHAEIVAIMHAQYVLSSAGGPPGPYTLVSSAEPCCQCFGALVWSGVQRLVCGATTNDVQAIGFDEGPKPAGWIQALSVRGLEVRSEVARAAAVRVLVRYAQQGGPIYGRGIPRPG